MRTFASQPKQSQSRAAARITSASQTSSGASHQAQTDLHTRPQTRDESETPGIVSEVLHSSGEPLEAATRAFFESRFGNDFSRVRVHTDARAAESAQAVKARAYTVGHDVVFAAGQYAPRTAAGRQLLAHELTHTVQQSGTSTAFAPVSRISRPHETAEREARIAAAAVLSGSAFTVTPQPRQIARDDGPSPAESTPTGPSPAEPTPTGPSPTGEGKDAAEGQHACVVKEEIVTITTPVIVFDDMVMMQTDVDIEWQPPASKLEPIHAITYCDCACGEYRQYVKGHIFRNGERFDIKLCENAKLEEDQWREDGDWETGLCYGHRDRKESKNDIFDRPNREWGCHYHGKDQPTVPGKAGDKIDVDLKFKGQTYDKCLNKFGPIHEWAFTYKGPLTSGI